MNRKKITLWVSAVALVATVFTVVLSSTMGIARVDKAKSLKLKLQRPDLVDLKFVAVNNWSYVMRNQGSYMYDSPDADGNGNNAGGEFPRGSGTTIVFAGGVYIASLKEGVPVVSETEFATEFQPGRITNDDVAFADLTAENPLSADNVVYLNDRGLTGAWPADGPRDQFGLPGIFADAQTWAVFNDLDVSLNQESDAESPNPGLGMQIVQESFAFNAGPLSDVVYFKFTITNKTNVDYTDSYIGLWMDPDVDDASNDVVGVDTARGLGFCYNINDEDAGSATGFDFFQGPVVTATEVDAFLASKFAGNDTVLVYDPVDNVYRPQLLPAGQITLGATAFNTYFNSTDPVDNNERYNLLAGRDKSTGIRKSGCGVNDYYAFRGNPVTPYPGQQACDVAVDADAADQRMLHCAGPFTLKAGEAQEIWAGVVGAIGSDHLDAVENMFETDALAQITFEAGLVAPAPPAAPKISVAGLDGQVTITWQNNAEVTPDNAGEILGINTGNGYSANYSTYDFQGYKIYKSLTGLPGSYDLLATYDKIDGLTSVINRTLNATGNLEIKEVQFGSDNGLVYDYTDEDVVNGQRYYYAVTAFDAQPYIEAPGYVDIPGSFYVRDAAGAGAAIIDETISFIAFIDSVDMVTDATYRSDGGGLMGDTVDLDHDGTDWIVYDVNHFTTGLRGGLPELGGSIRENRTSTYNTIYGNFSGTVSVTFTVYDEEIYNSTSVRKPSGLPISLESAPTANVTSVVPMKAILGTTYNASASAVTHSAGASDGSMTVAVVDPSKVMSANYTISHFSIPSDSQGNPLVGASLLPASMLGYQVLRNGTLIKIDSRNDDPRTFYDVDLDGDYTAGTDIALDESYFGTSQASGSDPGTQEPILFDGLKAVMFGAANDAKFFQVISNATGVFPNPDMGAFAFNGSGFPTFEGTDAGVPDPITIFAANDGLCDRPNVPNLLGAVGAQSVANGAKWGFHVGGGGTEFHYRGAAGAFVERVFRNDNFTRFVPYDFELRFTAAGGEGHFAFSSGAFAPVPFEIWNIGINTPTNTADDYRMYPRVFDEGGAVDVYDYTGFDHPISGGTNDPYLDWIYFMRPSNQTPGQAGYNATVGNGAGVAEVMARTVLVSFNGGDVTSGTWPANALQARPANGSTFRIVATKPNQSNDQFSFSATANSVTTAKSTLKKGLDDIKVVPNPYYGRSETYQASLFDKRIKFTNLPANCTIKIFTVAGDLVRTIQHNNASDNDRVNVTPLDLTATPAAANTSIEHWDLQNEDGKWVASGMYVALVEASGIGKRMVKFAVIQEEVTVNGPDNR